MSDLLQEKERLMNILLDGLEPIYPRGLTDWLYIHNRVLYSQLDAIEDRINEGFLNGCPIGEFKAVLREYWRACTQGIRLFRGRKENALNFPEVRAERIAEREAARAWQR